MNKSNGPHLLNSLNNHVNFLVFSASLQNESLNTQLASLAVKIVEHHGGNIDFQSMAEFDVPSYNQDMHNAKGFPFGAEEFRRHLEANDAVVMTSLEYNDSMSDVLKNAIDWISHYKPQPFNEKHILLLSASHSMAGGNRGLWSLLIPLEHLGAHVFPDMFSLSQADKPFDAEGKISDEQLYQHFDSTIKAFMELAEAAKNYPCAKKKWFEFLGEQTNQNEIKVER
jgi:chromate reductase, NAD(P)H dehydrogenase (quinone)